VIPVRFQGVCHLCQDPLDIRAKGVSQWVEGWVENRTGGGAHAIRTPVKHMRFACKWCVDKEASRTNVDQLAFFQ
jgi:hypothetical protein